MIHAIHKLICWYLRKCSGAFHCYQYGPDGRYVVLMNEDQYASYRRCCNTGTHIGDSTDMVRLRKVEEGK